MFTERLPHDIVGFQIIERETEACRECLDAGIRYLLEVHLIDVFLNWFTWVDFVLDPVQSSHQNDRKCKVRVA